MTNQQNLFTITLKSFAKINIFLEITGKSGSYHVLHSLFTRISIYDNITVKPAEKLNIRYSTPVEGDIIQKTVKILTKYFPNINTNFDFTIEKNIPIGSGLAGGSSNAAEVMKFLILQNNIDIVENEKLKIAEEIGADVPFFLQESQKILHGIGKELHPVHFKIPKLWCVILFPNVSISTKEVFSKISPPFKKFCAVASFDDALLRENNLQTPANITSFGIIQTSLSALFHPYAIKTAMSGSGSACFSLFNEEKHAKDCASKTDGAIFTEVI